jgi:hypothetical protein
MVWDGTLKLIRDKKKGESILDERRLEKKDRLDV